MKEFFKMMFASMLGFLLTNLIIGIVFIGIIVAIVSFANKSEVVVENNSILHLKLDQPILDRGSNNPFENFQFNSFKASINPGLNQILLAIKKAKNDKNIKGIYLDLTSIPSGIATIQEIRNALIDFKKSEKFIISYSEGYSQSAYYLASVADKVYLNPEGYVDFKGLSAQIMFLKGALEKLDIQAQIIRHGKYKSAVETFILDKMSEANKEQTLTFMQSIWDIIIKDISESRKISIEKLNLIADSLNAENAIDAYSYKMVDSLIYKDQLIEILMSKTGDKKEKDINYITLSKYIKAPDSNNKVSKNKIAVIYAVGEINSGKGDSKSIGSETISEAIRKARTDVNIKAIVLRVNSPGGSALASDIIWREMALAKKTKPVIVSMGDVAASGGYYISCAADTIVADQTTITGSIGVFGVVPNFEKFFKNKLGITFDVVNTNKNSGYMSTTRPLTIYEYNKILKDIEKIYKTFVSHVADGRYMQYNKVDSIGQGRVWSGADAKNIGLVDVYGGLNDAINIAAYKAKLKDYRIVEYPEQKEAFGQIMEDLFETSYQKFIINKLGKNAEHINYIEQVKNSKGIQARLPFSISIY